jgi:nitrogen fixation NifU-like protein
MSDDIYSQELKALAKAKHGAGELITDGHFVSLDNPLCGDRVTLSVSVDSDRIASVTHNVRGCLLCQAAASAIGASAPGMMVEEMVNISDQLLAMFKGEIDFSPAAGWEVLMNFKPVTAHKNRHSCVLLPFQAVATALLREV